MRSDPPIVAVLCLTALAVSGCGGGDKDISAKHGVEDWRAAYSETQQDLTDLREKHSASVARELALHVRVKTAETESEKFQSVNQELQKKFQEQVQRLNELVEDVEANHKKHGEEMEALRNEYREYQQKFRFGLREQAPGTELPQLTYDGITFVKPIVIEATPAALEIRHESGAARLDLALLSDEIRERFGYHPTEAAEHLKSRSGHKFDNLVTFRTAKDVEDSYKKTLGLRIAYKAWENDLAKADGAVRRMEARIQSLRNQLAKAKSGSFIINRLKNDIVIFSRDLKYLKRKRHELAQAEPFNPDTD